VCPNCGAHAGYTTALRFGGRFNWLVFFLGGLLAVLVHNASRKERVQCNACGAFFGIRTPHSKVALVVPTIMVLIVILLGAFLFG
jgi:hypothetical protein